MDVRCEKCGTEYELDEAKVTEVGVTVKCTSCGNLFKVRRKAGSPPTVGPATGVGLAPAPPADGTQKGMPASRPRPFTQTIPAPGGGVADGNTPVPGGWMVRNPDGQIQRFRELTTLQQWIVERKVSRQCEISRSGDSWRKLGEIAELTSFFHVVELADANARAAAERQSPRRNTQPFVPPGTAPATANANVIRTDGAPGAMQPKMLTDQVSVAPPSRAPSSTLPPPMASPPRSPLTTLQGHDQRLNPGATPLPGQPPRPPSHLTPPPIPAGAPPPLPHQLQAAIGPSGPNVSSGRAHGASNDPSGPTGGLRGAPVLEPSWAGSADAVRRTSAKLAEDGAADEPGEARRPMAPQAPPPPQQPQQQPQTFEAFDADDDLIPEPASRLPWLLAAMFVMLLGGAAAVYFLVMKKPANELAAVAVDAAVVELAADASGPVSAPLVDAQPLAPDAAQLLAEGWRHFYDDGDAAFEAAEKAFEKARGPEPDRDAEALAGLALVNSAWAQALADDADAARAADPRHAEQQLAESRRRLERAAKYAKDAAARAPTAPDATMAVAIAAADVRRLQKAKTAEVDKLLAGALGHPEANYLKGMQRWSAGQPADARNLLEVAAADFRAKKGREHLRARYRLALLALADKRYDVARQEVATMLAASPDHVRANALAGRIAAASGVGAGEVAAGGAPDAGVEGGGGAVVVKKPGGGGPPDPDAEPAGGYDALVAKGNTRAENGDCAGAMKLFERALDVRPGGVEALTGLGYCHLDRKEYARAQASFRAALGISPRYGDAIIGLAEAYRFQGQSPQAVEFYRRYVETNPNGPKAAMARRQIALLAPAETPPEKPPETPPDKPAEKPPEKPPDTPADVPPTDKLPDKPAEPPAGGATTP